MHNKEWAVEDMRNFNEMVNGFEIVSDFEVYRFW